MPHLPSVRTFRWIQKGSFAILDEGLSSGASFLLNVLLARSLLPAEYGAFVVALAIFHLILIFHEAFVTQPMLVFGANKYAGDSQQYLKFLLYGHFGLTTPISFILAIGGMFSWQWGSTVLMQALCGLAIAAPLILFFKIMRLIFYVYAQPQLAAIGGAVYFLLVISGTSSLLLLQKLSCLSAFTIMGLSGLFAGILLMKIPCPHRPALKIHLTLSLVLADHWNFGRWAAGTVPFIWMTRNIYYVLLPAWAGLEASAGLRAMMNLILPMVHVNTAIAGILMAQFSRMYKIRDQSKLRRSVLFASVLLAASAGIYFVFLVLFRHEVVIWLYGGQYIAYANFLMIIGALPCFEGVAAVLSAALKAMGRPDKIFWCHVASSLTVLVFGLWLLAAKGVVGAVVCLFASSITTIAVMGWFYYDQNHIQRMPLYVKAIHQ